MYQVDKMMPLQMFISRNEFKHHYFDENQIIDKHNFNLCSKEILISIATLEEVIQKKSTHPLLKYKHIHVHQK